MIERESVDMTTGSNTTGGLLDDLLETDVENRGELSHLKHVSNATEMSRTKDLQGNRLLPLNFRLTNQPVRYKGLQLLLEGIQAKTSKTVTLGKLMSALVDNREMILNDDDIVSALVESIRDM
jgi:hypothetical protein